MKIKENVELKFTPGNFKITEGDDAQSAWIKLGGLALNEGISKNGNKYTFANLKENDGRNFKWLFGHPSNSNVEEHVVGKGKLHLSGKELLHEGKIRNTARHPDVTQSVKDGFLGPSIHATAGKITEEDGNFLVEGLNIMGVGLVAFQGVKSASIDYAIAESFEVKESSEEDEKEPSKEDKMSEEEVKQPEAAPKEQPAPEAPVEAKAEAPAEEKKEEPNAAQEELKMLKEEIENLKSAKKVELVESIIGLNKDLKKEDLMKESNDRLNLMKEYEAKLANKVESAGIVEESEKVSEDFGANKDGDYSMTKEAYAKFNKELRERIN